MVWLGAQSLMATLPLRLLTAHVLLSNSSQVVPGVFNFDRDYPMTLLPSNQLLEA